MKRVFGKMLGTAAVVGFLACSSAPQPAAADEPRPVCRDFEQDISRVWNAEVKAQLRTPFMEPAISGGAATFEKIETSLDTVARDWVMLNERLCNDALVRGLISRELYQRLTSCLDTALVHQRAVIAALKLAPPRDPREMLYLVGWIPEQLEQCRKEAFADKAAAEERVQTAPTTTEPIDNLACAIPLSDEQFNRILEEVPAARQLPPEKQALMRGSRCTCVVGRSGDAKCASWCGAKGIAAGRCGDGLCQCY